MPGGFTLGNALRVLPEADLCRNYTRLRSQDLYDRVLQITPAKDGCGADAAALNDQIETQNVIRSAPIFRNISSGECQEIISTACARHYESRERIVHEGDRRGETMVLVSGRVKISQISHTGDEVILRISGTGDIIGGLGLAPRATHPSTISAMEPCKALSWKTEDFDRFCSRSTALQQNLVEIMSNMLRHMQDCFCDLATLKVSSRLARTLLRLAQQQGPESAHISIPFTCEELGQMAGTTLFTVSRLLRKWTEMGLLYSERRAIVIEDLAGLRAIANDCAQTPN